MIPTVKRILVVDEHPVIVSGLAALVRTESDWVFRGGVGTWDEARAKLDEESVDLLIVEPGLRGMDGLNHLREMAARAPVLCFSALNETLLAERALREGARGFVMKTSSGDEILAAIRTVLAGGIAVGDEVRRQVIGRAVGAQAGGPASGLRMLNNRELQIVHLMGGNRTSRQIAEHMRVSAKTIATHRMRIREKLQLRNSGELMRVAARWIEQDALS